VKEKAENITDSLRSRLDDIQKREERKILQIKERKVKNEKIRVTNLYNPLVKTNLKDQ
jgi:hypothetical protein